MTLINLNQNLYAAILVNTETLYIHENGMKTTTPLRHQICYMGKHGQDIIIINIGVVFAYGPGTYMLKTNFHRFPCQYKVHFY